MLIWIIEYNSDLCVDHFVYGSRVLLHKEDQKPIVENSLTRYVLNLFEEFKNAQLERLDFEMRYIWYWKKKENIIS